jgi:phospholipid/cholesterol/gamma-HCH transport system substrate-binding protein
MENKSHALAAGIFVLVASALLAALAVWLTRDQGEYHLYEISTSEIVSGLQPQAPVRYPPSALIRKSAATCWCACRWTKPRP